MARKILILTEGLSSPHSAKTACGVIRFRRDEVVGVLDTTVPPQPAQALLEVGGDLPVVNSLDALPEANVLLIGIAPPAALCPRRCGRWCSARSSAGWTWTRVCTSF